MQKHFKVANNKTAPSIQKKQPNQNDDHKRKNVQQVKKMQHNQQNSRNTSDYSSPSETTTQTKIIFVGFWVVLIGILYLVFSVK